MWICRRSVRGIDCASTIPRTLRRVDNGSGSGRRRLSRHVIPMRRWLRSMAVSSPIVVRRSGCAALSGEQLLSQTFDDENGWPLTPDGRGDSLVLVDAAGDADTRAPGRRAASSTGRPAPETWRARRGRTPGAADWRNVCGCRFVLRRRCLFNRPSTVDVRFGDDMLLAGYDLYLNGRPLSPGNLPTVRPGDELEYVLYWRKDRLARPGPYADSFSYYAGREDPCAGRSPRRAWSCGTVNDCPAPELAPDRYTLRIPADADRMVLVQSGRGRLRSGTRARRLPALGSDGTRCGDDYGMPALKIVRSDPAPAPQHRARRPLRRPDQPARLRPGAVGRRLAGGRNVDPYALLRRRGLRR